MQNVCCCPGLLARPVLSWSHLFSSLLSPFPSFSSFPAFIAPNLKMASYEMLPVRTPKLQRDLSSAKTEALLCSSWRVALAVSAQAGNSRASLRSSISMHHLDVAGIFLYVFPKAADEVRLQSVWWSAGSHHSTCMNATKQVSAFWRIGWGNLSPKGYLGLVFCQLRVVLKLEETNAKLCAGNSSPNGVHGYGNRKTVKKKFNRSNAKIFSLIPLSPGSEGQEILLCFLRGVWDFTGTVSLISQGFVLIFCVLLCENLSAKFCYTNRSG